MYLREWLVWLIRQELLPRYPDPSGDLPDGWRTIARKTAGYHERGEEVLPQHHLDAYQAYVAASTAALGAASAASMASVSVSASASAAATARAATVAAASATASAATARAAAWTTRTTRAADAAATLAEHAGDDADADAYLRMASALVRIAGLEPVPGLDAAILAVIETWGSLDMRDWHLCKTTHCRAGWALTIHPRGAELEEAFGSRLAASAIYLVSTGMIPDFFTSNEAALASIQEGASPVP